MHRNKQPLHSTSKPAATFDETLPMRSSAGVGCRYAAWESRMRRREFIAGLGSAALAAGPLAAQVRQRIPVVGVLSLPIRFLPTPPRCRVLPGERLWEPKIATLASMSMADEH
jgi:hypothetical protein